MHSRLAQRSAAWLQHVTTTSIVKLCHGCFIDLKVTATGERHTIMTEPQADVANRNGARESPTMECKRSQTNQTTWVVSGQDNHM
eukprot:scaffold56441_cov21-Prasinocladus_malaysianus.AAC.1